MVGEVERPGAEHWVPADANVEELRRAAPECRGCELWRDATQVVFSKGRAGAALMLVGEQPGDREDLEGEPFVGPAGRLLADAVDAAGIGRERVYVTNAVKHFRFERRGKRRIHEKPAVAQAFRSDDEEPVSPGQEARRAVAASSRRTEPRERPSRRRPPLDRREPLRCMGDERVRRRPHPRCAPGDDRGTCSATPRSGGGSR